MASLSFVDFSGLQYYDGKLKEVIASSYVTLDSAQTISGAKTFTATPVLNQVGLSMTVKDTNATTLRTSQVLYANSPNGQYGINIAFCSGGNCVVGGGEAGTAQLNALAGNSNEHLYLVADGNIYIKPNGNTWANARQLTVTTGGGIEFNALEATRGTAPSSTIERCLADVKDSASNRIGLISTNYYADKSSLTSIWAYKTTAATGNNIGNLGIGCDASGNVYTVAPTPTTGDNSTKIATTAFVNTKCGNYVAKTGDTMTGALAIRPSNVDLSTTSTSQRETWPYLITKNAADTTHNGNLMRLGAAQSANTKDYSLQIAVGNPRGGNLPTADTIAAGTDDSDASTGNCWGGIGVWYDYSKNKVYPVTQGTSAYAASDSSTTHLATTNWVRTATGNFACNAASATKATQDASGNVITTTYATKSELADSITTAQIDTLFA